jgi:hypothetical protein
MSNDMTSATIEVSCENCEVGYQVDLNNNDGNCYYDGNKWLIKKIPVFTKKESGSGICEESKVNLVKNGIPIYEECNKNQDCKFKLTPILDNCNADTGIRTIKYIVDIPQNGNGLTCELVGKLLGKQYTNFDEDISYDGSTQILTVNTTCDISQDCDIDLNPITTFCGADNKQLEVYKINKEEVNNGKECGKIIEEYYNKKQKKFTMIKKDDKIYTYTSCDIKKNENTALLLKIFIVFIIVYIIFLILK